MSFINIETQHVGFCKICSAQIHQDTTTGGLIKLCSCGTVTTSASTIPPALPHVRKEAEEKAKKIDQMVSMIEEEVDERVELLKLILLELRAMNRTKTTADFLKD